LHTWNLTRRQSSQMLHSWNLTRRQSSIRSTCSVISLKQMKSKEIAFYGCYMNMNTFHRVVHCVGHCGAAGRFVNGVHLRESHEEESLSVHILFIGIRLSVGDHVTNVCHTQAQSHTLPAHNGNGRKGNLQPLHRLRRRLHALAGVLNILASPLLHEELGHLVNLSCFLSLHRRPGQNVMTAAAK
jgi:hypothetical protein